MTSHKLVIAEKPSVAMIIGKVLNARKRQDGYIEGNGYIISWCIGHLVAPAPPDEYDDKYRRWDMLNLPIIPEEWQYDVLKGTSKQFNTIKKLMKRKDVTEVICATDAGREGEYIFRLVYNAAECKKPFKRLWISSLEEQAIREGFKNLHDGHEFDNMYHAASARSKADWLIGMNMTRLYSLKNNMTLNIGRVQTPVLNMLVERERNIIDFKPESYYSVELDCGSFKAVSDKIQDKAEAEHIALKCSDTTAEVTETVTESKSTAPPKLYDLTLLQRDANRIFGYTAKQTLDVAQKLYEQKLITYPRTDSRYITADVAGTIPDLFRIAAKNIDISADFVPDAKRITDGSKVSDHHALLPTRTAENVDISVLSAEEQNVFRLICKQLVISVAEPYKYDMVKIELVCGDTIFRASGKTVINLGWKRYQSGEQVESDVEKNLPQMIKGETFGGVTAEVKEHQTTPPKRYTEDTLLSAMENAVKSQTAERSGLGTPATRAGILENLVTRGFAERKGKSILPTDKGRQLIALIPDSLKSAETTAEWEAALTDIANGKMTEQEFVDEICAFISGLVAEVRNGG